MKRLWGLTLICAVAFIMLAVSPTQAQEGGKESELPDWVQRLTIKGLAFGDYFWNAAYFDPAVEGDNAFWFRRIYLTFNYDLTESENLKTDFRLRFEMNSPGRWVDGQLLPTRMSPFVKDAWMRFKWEPAHLILGLQGVPTWSLVENTWGYRSVQKTPLDLQRMGSSRDFGVAVRGRFDQENKFRYWVQYGNGSGTGGEVNDGKKVMVSIGYYPTPGFAIEAYSDYNRRELIAPNRATFQLFAIWRGDWGRVGVQGAHQYVDSDADSRIQNIDVFSTFGVFKLNDLATLITRYDRVFDPNPAGRAIAYLPFASTAPSNLIIGGVDFSLDDKDRIHLIPNLQTVIYDSVEGQETPDTSVQFRGTFYVKF